MRKSFFALLVLVFTFLFSQNITFGQTAFLEALNSCNPYTQEGMLSHKGVMYNIVISLKKLKDGKCQYKESISQINKVNTLTCKFNETQINYITDSMKRFYSTFEEEIAKNRIYEAKLTTNGEIFQEILINKTYCTIEESSK